MSQPRVLLLVCWMLVSGCVSVRHVALPERETSRLADRTVQRSAYPKPDFAAFTAGKAMVGIIGAGLMISSGNQIISENAVDDPATQIARQLAQAFAAKYGMRTLTSEPKVADSDDIGQLVRAYSDADFILDVRTINWLFVYFPTNWARYRVLYSARLRLIDRERQEAIAEEFCAHEPKYEDTSAAPTREELVGNNAAGLKRELAKAADHCIAFFGAHALRF